MLRGATRVAVLENVMNPTNLGAIFRSAAALGMDAVLLTSAGSDPLYRRATRGGGAGGWGGGGGGRGGGAGGGRASGRRPWRCATTPSALTIRA